MTVSTLTGVFVVHVVCREAGLEKGPLVFVHPRHVHVATGGAGVGGRRSHQFGQGASDGIVF